MPDKIPWRRTVAIDFDGCLCRGKFPEIGEPNWHVINEAKMEKQAGSLLILWTARNGEALENAIRACKNWGLEFDEINTDVQQTIEAYGGDSVKVFATEYWDDRARTVQDGILKTSPYKIATICKTIAAETTRLSLWQQIEHLTHRLGNYMHPTVIWHEKSKQLVATCIAELEIVLEKIKYAHSIHKQVETEKNKLLDQLANDHQIEPFAK